ncbi:MAG TPA: DUF3261 domain-containing protein [Thermoanaerobaculia bacterium]
MALLLALTGCRTPRPTGAAIAPLLATSPDDAMSQLRARTVAFRGARSLMRVRATVNGKTQSFRAQLAVHDANRMELIAYTPVGTTAMTMSANGNDVKVDNHLENTEWQGDSSELARTFGFFGTSLTPAQMSLLMLGYLPENVTAEATMTGLARASIGDVTVTFDPPSFPAKSLVVTRGADRIELEHLEVVGD